MATFHGYGRASTHEQKQTLIAQGERIEKEYLHRFAELERGQTFLDEGVSGKVPLYSRPWGQKLSMALEPGDVVCITKLDRMFRSIKDLVVTLERWDKDKVRLIALDVNVDTGTAVGKMFVQILAVIGEFERERIGERTREVLASMRARGLYACGQVPWGFMREKRKKGEKDILVPDPWVRKIAKKIIEYVDLLGHSYDDVYWHFRRSAVKTRQGEEIARSTLAGWYQKEKRLQAIEAGRKLKQEQENLTQTGEQP